jgi:hypothetical protein
MASLAIQKEPLTSAITILCIERYRFVVCHLITQFQPLMLCRIQWVKVRLVQNNVYSHKTREGTGNSLNILSGSLVSMV